MVGSNIGLKSSLLALATIFAIPAFITTKTQAASTVASSALSFVKNNKVAFIGAAAWFIIDTRLRTKARETFSMDDLKQDFTDLLDSLNIFDSKLYEQLVFLFDKYIIGLPIKLEDCQKRYAKDEEGTILILRTKKLTQKPFGLYGLLDAYVLMNVKKFLTETAAAAGLLYVYLNAPVLSLQGTVGNAEKTLSVTVTSK